MTCFDGFDLMVQVPTIPHRSRIARTVLAAGLFLILGCSVEAQQGLRKGDLLQVAVTPHDGEQEGRTINSVAALILNRPPVITSLPPAGL